MKNLIILIIIILTIGCGNPPIFLDSNGVTVKCNTDAVIGDKLELNGETYTVVDSWTLNNMIRNEQDVSYVVTSKITDMDMMFSDSQFNGDISNWDVSNVTNMYSMFKGSQFNGDISNWDVSKVKKMEMMFLSSPFNGDISDWDVSNVNDMSTMFYESNFNGDISNWDVSNVTNMMDMFYESNFNGDISNWDVSNVTNMKNMFKNSSFTYTPSLINWKLPNLKFAGGDRVGNFVKNKEYNMKFFKEIGWIEEELNKELYNDMKFVDKADSFVKIDGKYVADTIFLSPTGTKYRDDLNKLLNKDICSCLTSKSITPSLTCSRQFLITFGDSDPSSRQMSGFYNECTQ